MPDAHPGPLAPKACQFFCDCPACGTVHVMLFGHTHKPYHKVLESEGTMRHAINTGSVGKPKDGDPRAGYVLLTVDPERGEDDDAYCTVEHVRGAYDVEAAAQAVEASRSRTPSRRCCARRAERGALSEAR